MMNPYDDEDDVPPVPGARGKPLSQPPPSSHDDYGADPRSRFLNGIAVLVALLGLTWYAVLLASGEYFRWGIPLLVASSACKLLSVSPKGRVSAVVPRALVGGGKNARGRGGGGYRSLLMNADEGPAGGRRRLRARMMIPACYQRARRFLSGNALIRKFVDAYRSTRRRIDNDNHYNLICISTCAIIVPCAIYFVGKIADHLSEFREAGKGIDHTKFANDFGKLGASALSFLLLPVSKHSPILGALGLSEVHALRLHICAGCVALFGGICHGLYYTYVWIVQKGYRYDDVFPSGECLGGPLLRRDYDKECHSKLINLLGIVCGISLLALGVTSLYWVRRRFYRVFYCVHVAVSVTVLFGLVMHYNKMIWYLSPSLLCYLASNVPVHVEGLLAWWNRGGVGVSRVVCIPDSGGCVELSFRISEETTDSGTDGSRGAGADEADFRSFRDTVGRYAKLYVPEISALSHPFTIFADPTHPSETVHMLFRTHGSFTAALSKRLRALTLTPEPTPSELENHRNTFLDDRNNRSANGRATCPKMLINGIRRGTFDMLERALSHERVLVIAGGAGIVSYLSLIHALRSAAVIASFAGDRGDEDGESIIDNHRRVIYEDDPDGPDVEEDGGSKIGGASPSDVRSCRRRIDVHWMCRDEGLIRHVLGNYLEPFLGDTSDGLSINIVVHHTSDHAPSSPSSPGDGVAVGGMEPATWEWRRHASSTTGGEAADDRQSFAFPFSAYQGDGPSPSHNVLPAITYASTVFVGMWIVNSCYENLQNKYVVETRLVAVAGILLFSIVASLVSNAVLLASRSFYSRLFAYSRLEGGMSSTTTIAAEDAHGEIECGPVPDLNGNTVASSDSSTHHEPSTVGLHPKSSPQSPSSVKGRLSDCPILSISHERGRPNLSVIVHDAMKEEHYEPMAANGESSMIVMRRGEDDSIDVGVFLCGPAAMTDSALNAVWKEEKRRGPCGACAGRRAAVYQEVFEL